MGAVLRLNLQFRHQLIVGLGVFALQVLHEAAAFAYFFDEAAARGKVFLVAAQMLGEIADFLGQDRDLHLGRPGIRGVRLIFLNDALLLVGVQHVFFRTVRPRAILADQLLGAWPRVRAKRSGVRLGRVASLA